MIVALVLFFVILFSQPMVVGAAEHKQKCVGAFARGCLGVHGVEVVTEAAVVVVAVMVKAVRAVGAVGAA